jgi:DNA topoisomerase-2
MIQTTERRVSDFLNKEVRDFARYVVETRSCPSITDGLRAGARKIIYAALKGELSKKHKIKLLSLTGEVLKLQYHHGDTSLHNTIIQLASPHVSKFHGLEIIGQIGNIRQTNVDVAARYLSVKQSDHISLYEYDHELWNIKIDDGEEIEPVCFFPIIPTLLMYRTSSPGFGFSYKCFSYTFDSIIDNVIKSLMTGSCTDKLDTLIPDVAGITPRNFIYNTQKEMWYNVGEYTLQLNNDILIITDLPYNVQFEAYEDHLHDLIDQGIIRSFSNLSSGDKINYKIQFPYGYLKRIYANKNRFYTLFRLYTRVPKDILNVISENNSIVQYDDPYELIDSFVRRRLKIYDDRKTRTIKIIGEEINKLEDIIKFITLIVEEKITINKREISAIKKDLDGYNLPHHLLKTHIEKLTKDEIEKLQQKIQDLRNQLHYIKTTPVQTIYFNELISLKEKYSHIQTTPSPIP